MLGGINPWVGIWTNPRSTIRAIVNVNPRYGTFFLSWIFALHTYFFLASYFSLGISYSFYSIFLAGILSSPFVGSVWLCFTGWILHFTGSWLGGKAPVSHLRTAAAWSKIPSAISLLMWLILMVGGYDLVFIQGVAGPSLLFIHTIGIILAIWSIVLLIQAVQEVQGFTLSRTIVNIVLSSVISSLLWFFIFYFLFYFYLSFLLPWFY